MYLCMYAMTLSSLNTEFSFEKDFIDQKEIKNVQQF